MFAQEQEDPRHAAWLAKKKAGTSAVQQPATPDAIEEDPRHAAWLARRKAVAPVASAPEPIRMDPVVVSRPEATTIEPDVRNGRPVRVPAPEPSLDDMLAQAERPTPGITPTPIPTRPTRAPIAARGTGYRPGGRDVVGDVALSAISGAIGVPESVVGIADIVSGGRAGQVAEKVGFKPKEAKEAIRGAFSPEQQAASRAVSEAKGVVGKTKAALSNPSTIAHSVIESAPLMLGGAGIARGLIAKGLPAAVAAGIGEGVTAAGSAAEQTRQQSKDGRLTGRQAVLATGSGALTGALGVLGGQIAKKLGIADVDAMLAGATSPAVRRGIVREVVYGAFQEGLLEELPQSVQEQVLQNAAQNRPLTEGLDETAVMGALAGAAMGGGGQVGSRVIPQQREAPADQRKGVEIPVVAPTAVPTATPAAPAVASRLKARIDAAKARASAVVNPPDTFAAQEQASRAAMVADPLPALADVEATLATLTPELATATDANVIGELTSRVSQLEAMRRKLKGEPEPEVATADDTRAANAVRTVTPPSDSPAPASSPVAATEAPAQAVPTPVGSVQIKRMNVVDIVPDPARFQFKREADAATGAGGELKGLRTFDEQLAGVISVWRDPATGVVHPINGHNRLALAQRTGHPSLNVQEIQASTPESARAQGALANIAEGRGTALDAARFLRNDPGGVEAVSDRLSLKGVIARHGAGLAKLPDDVFARVERGELTEAAGAVIGAELDTPALQRTAANAVIGSGKRLSEGEVREVARQVRDAGTTTVTQETMFATGEVETSLFVERAQVANLVKKRLSSDKRLFGFVANQSRAEGLARGGNVIDVGRSKEIAGEAAVLEEIFNTLYTRSGPIASVVTDAAGRIARGERPQKVIDAIYDAVVAAVQTSLGAGLGRSGAGNQGADRSGDVDPAVGEASDESQALDSTDEAQNALFESSPSYGDSPTSAMRTGEGTVGAGFDKSLFHKLGANLYKGDLGVVALKEGLQNASDSMIGRADGTISIQFDERNRTLTLEDNGHGMSADTMASAFVDVGGSEKEEGAAGGYGLAKVSLFSHAKNILASSTVRKDGRTNTTTISGTGEDWREGRLRINEYEASNNRPGTVVSIQFGDDAKASQWQMQEWLGRAIQFSQLPAKITASFNGSQFTPTIPEILPDVLASVATKGAQLTFRETAARRDNESPYIKVHVLNRGLYQFTIERYVRGHGLPEAVVLNVDPSVAIDDAEYPFTTSREELKKSAADEAEKIISGLSKSGSQAEVRNLISAMNDKTAIGSGGAIYNTSGNIPQALLDELAARVSVGNFTALLAESGHAIGETVRGRGRTVPTYQMGGLGIDPSYLGINISVRALGDMAAQAGLERPTESSGDNLILYNPVATLNEVMGTSALSDADLIPKLAEQTLATLIHEVAHQLERGHTEGFAGVMTRMQGESARTFSLVLTNMEWAWRELLDDGFADIASRITEAGQAARKNRLQKISGHQVPEGQHGRTARETGIPGDAANRNQTGRSVPRPVGTDRGGRDTGLSSAGVVQERSSGVPQGDRGRSPDDRGTPRDTDSDRGTGLGTRGSGSVAERSTQYGGPDLFGNVEEAPTAKVVAPTGQEDMFNRAEEGTQLSAAERAARKELDVLTQKLPRTRPDLRAGVASRIAELERLINRNAKIGAGELATRAIADQQPAQEGGDLRLLESGAKYGAAESAPAFYSRLSRAFESGPPKATAEQWAARISQNVNKGEREWTGIDTYLAENTGKVLSRDDVQGAFDSGAIKVETVTLGEPKINRKSKYALPQVLRAVDQAGATPGDMLLTLANDGDAYRALTRKFPDLANDEDWAETVLSDVYDTDTKQTKFGQYTEPGGEDYHEVLITLKRPPTKITELPNGARAIQLQEGEWWVSDHDGNDLSKGQFATKQEAIDAALGHIGAGRFAVSYPDQAQFRSSHYDPANILVHYRAKRRTLPNGEKVLHVEELQSDWHQQGRSKGYKAAPLTEADVEVRSVSPRDEPGGAPYWESYDRRSGRMIVRHPGGMSEAEVRAEAMRFGPRENDSGVPDAPFKKTEDWAMLAMKHVIDEAVKGGYDRVAWTPGQLQADRYDLSKQVDRIEYNPTTGALKARKGSETVHSGTYDAKALPDVIGKDAADKLLNNPTRIWKPDADNNAEAWHAIEGDDLKVGGAGMVKFYDQMLPKMLAEHGKKIGAPIEIDAVAFDEALPQNSSGTRGEHRALTAAEVRDVARTAPPGVRAEIREIATQMTEQDTDWEAVHSDMQEYAEENGTLSHDDLAVIGRLLTARATERTPAQGDTSNVPDPPFPSFRITQALKGVVETKGQFLYEKGTRYASKDQTDLFADPTSPAALNGAKAETLAARGSLSKAGVAATKLAKNSPAVVQIRALGLPVAPERIEQIALANRRAFVPLTGQNLSSPQVTAQLLHPFRSPTEERFHVLYKDKSGKAILHSMVTSGSVSQVYFEDGFIQSIIDTAKQLGATDIDVAHNHPSGDPTPSRIGGDHSWTVLLNTKLTEAGITLGGHLVMNHKTAVWLTAQAFDDGYATIGEKQIDTGATGTDWTDAHIKVPSVSTGLAPHFAQLISEAVPESGFLAVYMNSQNGPVALVPYTEDDLLRLGTTIADHTKQLGARYVVLAGNPEIAKRLVEAVNSDRTAEPLSQWDSEGARNMDPATWSRHIRDVMGLTNDPTRFTSHRNGRLRQSSETLPLSEPRAHSVFEKPTPYDKSDNVPDQRARRSAATGTDSGRGAVDSGASYTYRTTGSTSGESGRVSAPPAPYNPPPPDVQAAADIVGQDIDFDGAKAKAAKAKTPRSLSSKLDRIADAAKNSLGPIERLGTLADNRPSRNPYDALVYAESSDATVERALHEGVLDPVTREVVGPSFDAIFEPLKHDERLLELAFEYLKAKRDVGRGIGSVRGNIPKWEAAEKLAAYGDADPVLSDFAGRWEAYTDAIGNYAVGSGLWTKDLWQKMKDSDVLYVRYKRIMEDAVKQGGAKGGGAPKTFGNVGTGVDSFIGSERAIENPARAIVEYTAQVIRRADRYRVGHTIMDAIDDLGPIGEVIGKRIPAPTPTHKAIGAQKARQIPLAPTPLLDEIIDLFDPRLDARNPVLWRNGPNGHREYMQIHADELWTSIMQLNTDDLVSLRAVLDVTIRPLKRIFTASTTGWSPRFSLATNPSRDIPTALSQTQAGLTAAGIAKGFKESGQHVAHNLTKKAPKWLKVPESTVADEASRFGLQGVSFFDQDRPKFAARRAAPINRRERIINRIGSILNAPVAVLEAAGRASDLGPRLGEFEAAKAMNMDKFTSGQWTLPEVKQRGTRLAKVVSLNFNKRPGNAVLRLIADYAPFYGVSTHAPFVVGESARRNPKRFGTVYGIGALAAVTAWAISRAALDDDEWEEFTDRGATERSGFLRIATAFGVYRIPLGQEMGILVNGVTAGLDQMFDDDPASGKLMIAAIIRALPAGLDALAKGFIPLPGWQQVQENNANRKAFGGRPVEPRRMERLPASERRLDTTAPTFDMMAAGARKMGFDEMSPLKAENLTRGLFSSATPLVTTATDVIAKPIMGRDRKPTVPRSGFGPLNPLSAFTESKVASSTESEEDFYALKSRHEQAKNQRKALVLAKDPTGSRKMAEQYGDLLRPQVDTIMASAVKIIDDARDDENAVRGFFQSGKMDGESARKALDRQASLRQGAVRRAMKALRAQGVSP